MGAIKTFMFASIILLTFLYGLIGFVGNYSLSNHLPLNATLNKTFQQIVGNQTSQGIFSSVSPGGNFTNASKQQPSATGYIGTAIGFVSSIKGTYQAIAYFTATPLNVVGISTSQYIDNIILLIILIIIITIVSAFFIFAL